MGRNNLRFSQCNGRSESNLRRGLPASLMCNFYSITKGQAAIIEFTRAMQDTTGNLPPLPGIFPTTKRPWSRTAAAFVNCA